MIGVDLQHPAGEAARFGGVTRLGGVLRILQQTRDGRREAALRLGVVRSREQSGRVKIE